MVRFKLFSRTLQNGYIDSWVGGGDGVEKPGLLGHSDVPSYWYTGERWFDPLSRDVHSHEIISMVVLFLPLMHQLFITTAPWAWDSGA